jgi:hypothetical protein
MQPDALWKVIIDGRPSAQPNKQPAATRFWVYVAASSRQVAREAAWAYVRSIAPALSEAGPVRFGQSREQCKLDSSSPARHEGEIVTFEVWFAGR